MKLISYNNVNKISLGVLEDDMIYDLNRLDSNIADNMLDFIKGGENQLTLAKNVVKNIDPIITHTIGQKHSLRDELIVIQLSIPFFIYLYPEGTILIYLQLRFIPLLFVEKESEDDSNCKINLGEDKNKSE